MKFKVNAAVKVIDIAVEVFNDKEDHQQTIMDACECRSKNIADEARKIQKYAEWLHEAAKGEKITL